MLQKAKDYCRNFISLFYPNICLGCSNELQQGEEIVCTNCFNKLPVTHFFTTPNNPVEKTFYGRIHIENAGACFYFTKHSIIQELILQLKYKGNKEAGIFLGQQLGRQLSTSELYRTVDAIVPLPLNVKKEKIRGYNQAEILAQGVIDLWEKPLLKDIVIRRLHTETQTRKGRIDRWNSMQDAFTITKPELIENKHVLLVDDVITTGATLEACATAILQCKGTKVSIAAVGWTI